MALAARLTELRSSLDLFAAQVRNFASQKTSLNAATAFSLQEEYYLEGLSSRLWQVWCGFCRACIIESCLGTTNAAGTVVPSVPGATSEAHVSSAAIRARAKAKPPYWGATNTSLRREPTWGDVDVLALILPRLGPANSATLLAAFSTASRGAKALQIVRNAAAHNNIETAGDLASLRSRYQVFSIGHPTHAMFWIEPVSGDFLVTHAVGELEAAALVAIS
jgi:hypothetical protein